GAVDPADNLRASQVEQIRIAAQRAIVILEALAAIGLLTPDLPLDEDAPRTVEHGDALGEDGFQSCARVLHPCSVQPRENGVLVGRAGSLGVFVSPGRQAACQSYPGCTGKIYRFSPGRGLSLRFARQNGGKRANG